MEPRLASSAFPFAIRARLSTEDSASDASSFIAGDSDDNAGIDGSEEEDDEDSEEDNAASLLLPLMPIARVTGDDDDGDDELVFDDDDDEEEEEEEEENPKLAVESSNAGVDEDFGSGFVYGREESGLFYGNEEKNDSLGDEGSVIVFEERLCGEKGYVEEVERMAAAVDEADADDGGLELSDVMMEMNSSRVEEDLDFSAVVYEKTGDVGYGNMKENEGFELDLKGLEVESCIIDSENNNLVGDVDSAQISVMELELRALGAEPEAGHLVIPEVEDIPVEIVKVEVSGVVTSRQDWNEEAEAKTADAGFSVLEELKEEAAGHIDSKNGLFVEKMLEAFKVEADSTESERFETANTAGVSHSQILEMISIHDSKAFEPKHPEVCAVNMEAENNEDLYGKVNSVDSEKAMDSTCKLLVLNGHENAHGSCSPSKEVYAQYLDNFKEKNDEPRVVKEVSITESYNSCEFCSDNLSPFNAYEKGMESRFDSFDFTHGEGSVEEDEHVNSEWPAMVAISENSEHVKHILKEMEEGKTDEDGDAKELFDTSTLAALLRDSSGASSGGVDRFTYQDASAVNDMTDEEKMLQLKVEQIWSKYLSLVQKLGYSADDTLPDHVLYRMGFIDLARSGRKISEKIRLGISKKEALQLDECKGDFTFSCTILVIGKTGVGKSAIINSIFGEERTFTDPFQPSTTSVREISGMVDGVYIRFIDTPGLLTSLNDQRANRKILSSIKKYTRGRTPDVVLYVDRLDTYNLDFNDLPIVRMITSILGSSIWFNAIIVLTHAASVFPDEPDGSSMSYEVFVAQRSKVVQQSIRQVAENACLVNWVSLVENHLSCRRNMDGESILPNGLRWRPWLLLLCYSLKILSELSALMKLEIPPQKKLFSFNWPNPIPVFLSSLMQSKVQECDGDNYDSDIDLDNLTKEVLEEDDEYDQLSAFKPLKKSKVQKLNKEQKIAYFDKYDYRLKLLQKKKWKEELKRLKKMKGGKRGQDDTTSKVADLEQEANAAAAAISLLDMTLPHSFDGEIPSYLHRFLELRSLLLTRPVLHTHSWDHDYGYHEVSIDDSVDIAHQLPVSLANQITKDKKEFTTHIDSTIRSKPPTDNQVSYSLQCETKFKNLKKKTVN